MSRPALEAFLDAVCEQIRCREVHAAVRLELSGHVLEVADALREQGLSEEEAIQKAVARMGDPAEVGADLDKAHRPRTEWGLLGAAAGFLLLGLWAMYAVDVSGSFGLPFGTLLFRHIAYICGGIVAGSLLYLADYRRLKLLSWPLYGLGVYLAWLPFPNRYLNLVTGALTDGSPFILAVALAGMLAGWRWNSLRDGLKALVLLGAPAVAYFMAPDLSSGVMYAGAAGTLLLASRPKAAHWAMFGGVGTILSSFLAINIWSRPWLRERLMIWLSPDRDPTGAGYATVQSLKALRNGGLWGQGATVRMDLLPEVHKDFIFPYLVYTLGWVAGVAIILGGLFFIARLLKVRRQVREPHGAMLVTGVGTVLAMQLICNPLVTAGILPAASVSLPFVSFGPSQILTAAAVGLALGVFRRKDMVPAKLPLSPE